MRKLIAFFVVAVVAVTANQAFAQCATCAGSAPTFSQPVMASAPQVYSAPVENYSAPVAYQSAPVQYGTAAPMQYETAAPIQYGTPVMSSGCSSCGGMGGVSTMGTMSGEMSPYSTQGLPPGAVVISDVVAGEGSSEEGTTGEVEGTVVESTSVMGATEAVEPPAPEEDAEVDKLPTEEGSASKAEGSANKAMEAAGDGT
ncbi:hypothetical protein N9L06_03410 [Mariniblastus sp.]|nr:hypothetical protein [Mariniblastus sp.]